MSRTPPAKAKPDPVHCADCGPTSPPPTLARADKKQREFRCGRCGLAHVVGLAASVTPKAGKKD